MGRLSLRFLVALSLLIGALAVRGGAFAQDALQPGEALVTGFSGTTSDAGRAVIDIGGTVGSIVDPRDPGTPPSGARWVNAPQRSAVTAGQVGQVFGVTLDDANPPNIYLTATSAFGLHRNADSTDWMAGMWGPQAGPGTVWKLDAANNYQPEIFARISLEGRPNSGAALGNIAFDRWNKQFFVSDLETGMIHRLRASDGADLGHYDHGVDGRSAFLSLADGELHSLPPIPFDPASGARLADCPSGDFARTPSCWNFADFRRRVWGVGMRRNPATEEVRLYYAVWGSQGFGNPDRADASEDDQRNSVWSVALGPDGDFDTASVRLEFLLPDFFRSPEAIARAGRSHPVSDIAFPVSGDQDVMLVAERGGVRNLGLAAENAFAYPHEARVLRYELIAQGVWRGAGRHDIGFYDRGEAGPPYIRGSAAGGVSFGMGYDDAWKIDADRPNAFVWMTGDGLCSPRGLCLDPDTDEHADGSDVDGLQGREARPYEAFEPITAFQPYPAPGPMTPATGPDRSFMIDLDGEAPDENDITRIGDVVVYQPIPTAGVPGEVAEGVPGVEEELPPGEELPPDQGWDPAPLPPDGWPVPPPPLLETDLGIEKTGPAQCQEGVNCVYTIKITNLGVVPYIGPLAVNDTMPEDATLAAASDGWHCDVAGQVVRCVTLDHAILHVGTPATLKLTILLPADVAEDHVENCAAIDWFEMGTDDGPGDTNDLSCIETPVTEGFDLGIEKIGNAQCVEGANCHFFIRVTNHGLGEFSGVLAVRDTLPANASLVPIIWMAGWSCTQTNGEVECHSPEITLPDGGVEGLDLILRLPDGIAGSTIENCAAIDWAAMDADDGAGDVHVDADCHSVDILPKAGFFDLAVSKTGPAHCDAGGNCDYTITVTNEGPDDYAGEIAIQDVPPAGSAYVGASAGWGCAAAVPVNCHLLGGPHVLHQGDSHSLTLTIQLPAPAPSDPVMNCADLRWPAPGMPPDDVPAPGAPEQADGQCTFTFIDTGFDIEIGKTGPAECYEGGLCDYSVSLTNHGPRDVASPWVFTDMLPAGAVLEGVLGPGATCNPLAPGTVRCIFFFGFPAGTVEPVTLRVRLPDPVIGETVENCATLDWGPPPPGMPGPWYSSDDDATTDGPACVPTPVLAADLAPFGGTICKLGETCTLDVFIKNRGGRLFKGSAGLKGTLKPAVSITGIEALTSGLTCEVTGNGTYECEAEELTLKPDDEAKLKLSVAIPEDFPHKRIIHRKEMLWPDTGVKDRKPGNDHHTSTIMIVQEEEPDEPEEEAEEPPVTAPPEEPKPPPPPECIDGKVQKGECVCPKDTERKKTGPNAYACEKLPPPITCKGGNVRNGKCYCPKGTERKKTGTYEYACEKLPPPITCKGGSVKNATCYCPKGTERKKTGTYEYACEKLPPPITCKGGNVRNGKCYCPKGTERKKTGTYAYSCVKLPPPPQCDKGWSKVDSGKAKVLKLLGWKIKEVTSGNKTILCAKAPPPPLCIGGSVRDGQCICPKGTERKQTGTYAYTCVKLPPPLTCKGGKVRKGKCVCPKGTERKQTGTYAYTCVKSELPPPLTCTGGRVYQGQCLCPKGTKRKKTGTYAFNCVKTAPPLTCTGGTVRNGKCYCPKGTKRKKTGTYDFNCMKTAPTQSGPSTTTPELKIDPKLLKKLPRIQ